MDENKFLVINRDRKVKNREFNGIKACNICNKTIIIPKGTIFSYTDGIWGSIVKKDKCTHVFTMKVPNPGLFDPIYEK